MTCKTGSEQMLKKKISRELTALFANSKNDLMNIVSRISVKFVMTVANFISTVIH